jgi:hypothetical protein
LACQSATGALVGALGLRREVAFGLAHRLVCRPDVAPALAAWGAGGELNRRIQRMLTALRPAAHAPLARQRDIRLTPGTVISRLTSGC